MNIVPVGAYTATRLSTAPSLASAQPEGPRDRAELGVSQPVSPGQPRTAGAPEPGATPERPTAPETTPAKLPVPPPPGRPEETMQLARRLAERQQYLPHALATRDHLAAGKLKGEMLRESADWLYRVANFSEDPLTQRIARSILTSHVNYPGSVSSFKAAYGPLRGPQSFLGQIGNHARREGADRRILPLDEVALHLKALGEAPGVDARAIRVMWRLAHSLATRADAELHADVRQKESPEQQRQLARQAAGHLQDWWARGQLTVCRDGQVLEPGTVQLENFLDRFPPIDNERRIDLSERPAPRISDATRQLLEDIPHLNEAPGIERFKQADAATVREFLALTLDPASRTRELGSLTRLIREGGPEVHALLEPHLQEMSTLASRAESVDCLCEPNNLNGEEKALFYRELARAYPQIVDERFLHEELGPLLTCNPNVTPTVEKMLTEDIWPRHPDLIDPTLQYVVRKAETESANENCLSLFAGAAEAGHKLTPTQGDWLVSGLWHPHFNRDDSLTMSKQRVTQAVERVLEVDPGFLDGKFLPAPDGNLRPVRRAILERFLEDPAAEPEDRMVSLTPPLSLVKGQVPELIEPMLERLESVPFDRAGKLSLLALSTQNLAPEHLARLRATLRDTAARSHWQMDGTLNKLVRAPLETELLGRMADTERPVAERAEALDEYLRLGIFRLSGSHERNTYLDRAAGPFLEGFRQLSPAGRQSVIAPRLETLRGVEPAGAGMTPEQKVSAQALEILTREVPEARAEFFLLLSSRLGTEHSRDPLAESLVLSLLGHFQERLADPSMEAAARRDALESGVRFGHEQTWSGETWAQKLSEAAREGVTARTEWGSRLVSDYPEDFHRLDAAIADEQGWHDFQLLREATPETESLDGPTLLKAFEHMQTSLAMGASREDARRIALEAYLIGGSPITRASTLADTPTHLRLGGVQIRKRNA